MSIGNGDHVSWRELNLALDPIKADLKEISIDLIELKTEVRASRLIFENRDFLGQRGRTILNGLLIAVPAALCSVIVTILLRLG